jgi:hypothetical protein
MASLWRFLVSTMTVGLFDVLLVVLWFWSIDSLGVPYAASVSVGGFLAVTASLSLLLFYRGVKRAAGRALGLSARDSRRLDIGGPELLSASVAHVRGGQPAGSPRVTMTTGDRDLAAGSSDEALRVPGRVGSARRWFAGAYLVIGLGLIVYAASLGWQPFLAESAGLALIGIPMGLFVVHQRRVRSRRLRVIAAQLPGWQLYSAIPAMAELVMLRSADFQPATTESFTIAYGPGGIQVWAQLRPPRAVCTLPWHEVADVRADDVRTMANTTRPGLVVLLQDGSRHEFQLARRRDFSVRPITRAQLAVLVDEIRASRPLAA